VLVFWSLVSLVRNSVVLAVYLLFSVACFFTVHEHYFKGRNILKVHPPPGVSNSLIFPSSLSIYILSMLFLINSISLPCFSHFWHFLFSYISVLHKISPLYIFFFLLYSKKHNFIQLFSPNYLFFWRFYRIIYVYDFI